LILSGNASLLNQFLSRDFPGTQSALPIQAVYPVLAQFTATTVLMFVGNAAQWTLVKIANAFRISLKDLFEEGTT
jgi:hypothetical protein